MKRSMGIGLVLMVLTMRVLAQVVTPPQQLMIKPKGQIVCYASGESHPVFLPAPASYTKSGRTQTTDIRVTYEGFPSNAQAAFQRAVDIWAGLIQSPVRINILAQWRSLNATTLGQANYGDAFANFDGAPKVGVFYPVALAEKLAGRELNKQPALVNGVYRYYDIYASFNSNIDWAFTDDPAENATRYNLTTVVLHEVGHGLGFTDSFNVTAGSGSYGVSGSTPIIYDIGVENGASNNARVFDQTTNTTALGSILVNRNINYNPGLTLGGVAGTRAKLYAPATWSAGSSIAHLDQATYTSSPNMLMRPQLDKAQITLTPGPIVLDIFADMGWVSPLITHTRLKDTEVTSNPFTINAIVASDGTTGYSPNSTVKIRYIINSGAEVEATMTPGSGNLYSFQLPKPVVVPTLYSYYIITTDNYNGKNRTFTKPGQLVASGKTDQQLYFQFTSGPDTKKPVISTVPLDYISLSTPAIQVQATVTDNIEVGSVTLSYQKNGGILQNLAMTQDLDTLSIYRASIPTIGTTTGDVFTYKIVATDVAAIPNSSAAPTSGVYSVLVLGPVTAQTTYQNNFNSVSADFFGNSYSIGTPAGFANGAIHSAHPYENGSGPRDESNYVYQLRIPIKISADNPYILFDEIVLVEPGENGSVFGDQNFWDYVIVEGSTDNGTTWKRFVDGYDSRANSSWLSKWSSSKDGDGNSTANGDPTLYKARVIKMTDNGNFKANDEVQIRFRLFADQGAHGWGWAIDNLNIQTPITGFERTLAEATLSIYPNPSAGSKLVLKLETPNNNPVKVVFLTASGGAQQELSIQPVDNHIEHEVTVSEWSDGFYIVKAEVGGAIVTRKFIKSQ